MSRDFRPPCRIGLPRAGRGQAVGLLGGSFDPPHAGHVRVTLEALRRFGLDQVWWIVSPGNPLKRGKPAGLRRRVAEARRIMRHPRVRVCDVEDRLGTRRTLATLRALARLYPGARFVWLMGADSLATLHEWDRWREVMRAVPVGVLPRPGAGTPARGCRAAATFAFARLPARDARLLARSRPPRWCFANAPMLDVSSSALRGRDRTEGGPC